MIHQTSLIGTLTNTVHCFSRILSETKGIYPLLADSTQVESKKTSQIQWPVPSIKVELVDVFFGE